MTNLSKQIEDAIDETMTQLSKAAGRRDFSVIDAMTNKASELRTLQQQLTAIENRFRHLAQGATSDANSERPLSTREIAVEISQGMINQNLLTLTDAVKKGLIRVGEKMVIETQPNGTILETQLLANGNKLRERGKIGRFYREAAVQAGDTIVLRELTPGRWELRKSDFVRYRRT